MNRYFIRVDETLIKSLIKILKSANRIYGCRFEPGTSDKVEKTMNDSFSKIAAKYAEK